MKKIFVGATVVLGGATLGLAALFLLGVYDPDGVRAALRLAGRWPDAARQAGLGEGEIAIARLALSGLGLVVAVAIFTAQTALAVSAGRLLLPLRLAVGHTLGIVGAVGSVIFAPQLFNAVFETAGAVAQTLASSLAPGSIWGLVGEELLGRALSLGAFALVGQLVALVLFAVLSAPVRAIRRRREAAE